MVTEAPIHEYDFSTEIDTMFSAAEAAGLAFTDNQKDQQTEHWRDAMRAARFLTNLAQGTPEGGAQFWGEVNLVVAGETERTNPEMDPSLVPFAARLAQLPQQEWLIVVREVHNLGVELNNQRDPKLPGSLANFVARTGAITAGWLKLPEGPGDEEAGRFNEWLTKAFTRGFLERTAEYARQLRLNGAINTEPTQQNSRVIEKKAQAVHLSEELGPQGDILGQKISQAVVTHWSP